MHEEQEEQEMCLCDRQVIAAISQQRVLGMPRACHHHHHDAGPVGKALLVRGRALHPSAAMDQRRPLSGREGEREVEKEGSEVLSVDGILF